jgi:2,4-dienoyl-CoA reductase-like NADH-dependent reductase (Old Yellow Enzyme family)
MSTLFSPLTLRDLTLQNRIGVSPMCQYSAVDGIATDWHLVHLGGFATGGAGLVIAEAAAVVPEGRISAHDLGLWDDAQIPMLRRITDFIHAQGSVAAIQLAHAGRKASTKRPWEGSGKVSPEVGGWQVKGPSGTAFSPDYPIPEAMTVDEITATVEAFASAARRALAAGFRIVEVHGAHGYLLHEFLSPLANQRTDAYGGPYEHRVRLMHEVCAAVRRVWPAEWPVFVRISATDWVEGGWTIDESVRLSTELRALGVDLIDCSSAGLDPRQQIPVGPGFQVPFAARIRREAAVPTAAVGLITDAAQANAVIATGEADLVLLARELLRNPRWPLLAASTLGVEGVWPKPYERAKPR